MITGVFTTIKVKNKIPLFFDKHKSRLIEQAKKLDIEIPKLSLEKIKKYLQKNNLIDCALRITIYNKNEIIIENRPLPLSSPVKLLIQLDIRDKFKIYKTTNRTINKQAKMIAEENGSDDALFVLNNTIVESTIANIFSLNVKGELITPKLDNLGLKGIARQIIMKNAKVIEQNISANTMGSLVLVNSLRVQKITHLNGKKIQDGESLLKIIKKILEHEEKKYLKIANNNETI